MGKIHHGILRQILLDDGGVGPCTLKVNLLPGSRDF